MTYELLESAEAIKAYGDVMTTGVGAYGGRLSTGRNLTEFEPQVNLPRWFDTVLSTVHRLLRLKPGWDSYGSEPLSPNTVQSALGLLLALYELVPELPRPDVIPTPAGGLALEWSTADGSVEIEVNQPRQGCAFLQLYAAGVEESAEFRYRDIPAEYLRRLYAGIVV